MFDFKIIGAGPTGSYCAARLAKLGYGVQLVDKAQFPRDKLCGGGMTLKSISRIKSVFTGFDQSGIVDYIEDFKIMNPASCDTINFNSIHEWLGLVKREEFDNWMRNKAIESGVEFKQENKLYMSESLRESPFIIAADGVNSEIGKYIHGPFPNDEVVIATEAYVPNTSKQSFATVVLNSTHDPDNGGYSWIFARHDRIGIGTGVMRNYDRWMHYFRHQISKVAQIEYGYEVDPKLYRNWVIPVYKKGRRANITNNVACIGDALGVADPIYAEGIAAGMISADVLIKSFQTHDSFDNFTQDLHNHEYFKQMKWMELLQRQANANWELAFHTLKLPHVVQGFLKFINWQQTPKQFINWMIVRHPISISRLQYYAWKNKGKEL